MTLNLRSAMAIGRGIRCALYICAAMLLAAPPVLAQKPLVIAKQGYFFVGGRIDHAIEGSPTVGQMYVEYQIPAARTKPLPVIMIHGGSQTGTNFTGTPDGRDGWAQYFLRRGYAVYVVDSVGRGRSAYWPDQPYGAVTKPRISAVEQRFVAPERFEQWPQAHLHNQFPGTGRPGDPHFDQFYASQVPSIANFAKQQEINTAAGVALLDKLGPSIVLTHSQSGAFGWPITDQRPNLVKALIQVEPNGPPVRELEFKGAPEWFADNLKGKAKTYGLGEVPLSYDPPLAAGQQLEFIRQEKPDRTTLARCWLQKEPARKLPKLNGIPTLIIVGEASYHAAYDHCTSLYIAQAGVKHTFVRLEDRGIRGNGHMMMLEKNNQQIAKLMADWLDQSGLSKGRARR